MSEDEVLGFLSGLDGVLIFRPGPGDGSPEISWGDSFVYYAPTGRADDHPALRHDRDQDYPATRPSHLNGPVPSG